LEGIVPLLRKLSTFAAVTAAALVLAHPLAAADNESELKRLAQATETLKALVQTPDDGIPEHILQRAEAIVVIPNLIKGGFIIGAESGKGVMSIRDAKSGGWSAPSFVQMTGGSIGWQIGVEAVDLVLLVMNKDGVDDLLKSEFKLGGEGSVAAGPVGRSAQAATDARMGAKILAYSRAKGVFAGLTFQGSSLRDDEDANKDVYGRELDSREVFAMAPPSPLAPEISRWLQTLKTTAPAAR
jgi:lipid-binding SYLF domain-containing protein